MKKKALQNLVFIFMNVYNSLITYNHIHSPHIINVLVHVIRYFKDL